MRESLSSWEAAFASVGIQLTKENSRLKDINTELLAALEANALKLHAERPKVSCYYVETFADCDTPCCAESRALIARVKEEQLA